MKKPSNEEVVYSTGAQSLLTGLSRARSSRRQSGSHHPIQGNILTPLLARAVPIRCELGRLSWGG